MARVEMEGCNRCSFNEYFVRLQQNFNVLVPVVDHVPNDACTGIVMHNFTRLNAIFIEKMCLNI